MHESCKQKVNPKKLFKQNTIRKTKIINIPWIVLRQNICKPGLIFIRNRTTSQQTRIVKVITPYFDF